MRAHSWKERAIRLEALCIGFRGTRVILVRGIGICLSYSHKRLRVIVLTLNLLYRSLWISGNQLEVRTHVLESHRDVLGCVLENYFFFS